MKKILVLLTVVTFSQAGVDEVIKNNSFGLHFTPKNLDNIKIGAGLVIGGFALKGMLNAPYYIKQVEIESQIKRNDLKNDLTATIRVNNIQENDSDQRYTILKKNYDKKLNKINRTEIVTKGFWYTVPTLGVLGSLSAIAYWFKS